MNAAGVIAALRLAAHREGGYFRETYRAAATLRTPRGDRSAATTVLFLVTTGSPSRLHRLASDELWVHQAGDPLELARLEPREGIAETLLLGPPAVPGAQPQLLVPSGMWQGARVAGAGRGSRRCGPEAGSRDAAEIGDVPASGPSPAGWALACCVVTPGFDYQDFELGDRDRLLAAHPCAGGLIRSFT